MLDRYVHSGIAYGMANGLDEKWCGSVEQNLLFPDVVIFLDLSPIQAQHRIAARKAVGLVCRNFRYDNVQFRNLVSKAYHDIKFLMCICLSFNAGLNRDEISFEVLKFCLPL